MEHMEQDGVRRFHVSYLGLELDETLCPVKEMGAEHALDFVGQGGLVADFAAPR